MTDSFERAIDRLTSVPDASGATVTGRENGKQVKADIVAAGPVGVRIRELAVTPDESDSSPVEIGRRLAGTVTYLDEPLDIIEHDEESRGVQMRSSPPSNNGDSPEYFELTLSPQQRRLARFRGGSGPREQIPFDMTKQSLRRLVKDLTQTSSEPNQ